MSKQTILITFSVIHQALRVSIQLLVLKNIATVMTKTKFLRRLSKGRLNTGEDLLRRHLSEKLKLRLTLKQRPLKLLRMLSMQELRLNWPRQRQLKKHRKQP
jgi:hypothetical protein